MSRKIIEKDCETCGKHLVRRPGESMTNWRKRRTCNAVCGHALTTKKRYGANQELMAHLIATKKCSVCGGEMTPRKDETTTTFGERDVCSRSCANVKRWGSATGFRRAAPKPRKAPPKPRKQVKAPPKIEHRFERFPEVQRRQQAVATRFTPDFKAKYCEVHPNEMLSAWGLCHACTAGGRWAERERSIKMKPRTAAQGGGGW